jgi:hypothetical protein
MTVVIRSGIPTESPFSTMLEPNALWTSRHSIDQKLPGASSSYSIASWCSSYRYSAAWSSTARVGSPVVTVRGSLAGGLGEREPADDPDDPQEGSHRSGDPHAPASDRHREIKAGGERPLEDDTCD